MFVKTKGSPSPRSLVLSHASDSQRASTETSGEPVEGEQSDPWPQDDAQQYSGYGDVGWYDNDWNWHPNTDETVDQGGGDQGGGDGTATETAESEPQSTDATGSAGSADTAMGRNSAFVSNVNMKNPPSKV